MAFLRTKHGPLAQLAEQLTLNQRVSGSSPEWITKHNMLSIAPLAVLETVCQGRFRYDPSRQLRRSLTKPRPRHSPQLVSCSRLLVASAGDVHPMKAGRARKGTHSLPAPLTPQLWGELSTISPSIGGRGPRGGTLTSCDTAKVIFSIGFFSHPGKKQSRSIPPCRVKGDFAGLSTRPPCQPSAFLV